MSSWAPIVHGRTYLVDFRSNLIVVPEDFHEQEIVWARAHILVTTRQAEKLPGRPRWSIFKSERHCVVGVTCMADEVSETMTRDSANASDLDPSKPNPKGRPLYVFLGWVCRAPFAPVPPRELCWYRELYHYVRARWAEKHQADTVHLGRYEKDNLPAATAPPGDCFELSSQAHSLKVWPDADPDALWASAAAQHPPVSLCLGLENSRDALDGPLLNVAVAGISAPHLLEKSRSVPALAHSRASPPQPAAQARDVAQPELAPAKEEGGFLSWLFGSSRAGHREQPARQRRGRATDQTPAAPVGPARAQGAGIPAGFKPKAKTPPLPRAVPVAEPAPEVEALPAAEPLPVALATPTEVEPSVQAPSDPGVTPEAARSPRLTEIDYVPGQAPLDGEYQEPGQGREAEVPAEPAREGEALAEPDATSSAGAAASQRGTGPLGPTQQ